MTHTFDLLRPPDWSRLTDFLFDLRDKKVKLTVIVKPYRKRRSVDANRYYFGVIVRTLSEHFGYRPDDMHNVLLGTYTGWDVREFRGQKIYVPRRTSTTPNTMDVIDFQGLIQTGQQIAAEEGIILPDQDHADKALEKAQEEA